MFGFAVRVRLRCESVSAGVEDAAGAAEEAEEDAAGDVEAIAEGFDVPLAVQRAIIAR